MIDILIINYVLTVLQMFVQGFRRMLPSGIYSGGSRTSIVHDGVLPGRVTRQMMRHLRLKTNSPVLKPLALNVIDSHS